MCTGIMRNVFTLGVLVTIHASSLSAAEQWADPNLSVHKGLDIWLDASRQNAARQSAKQPEILSGTPVGLWLDGSGNRRHLVQKIEVSRPSFYTETGYAAMRFDGERRFLSLSGLDRSYKDITIFVVALPFANAGEFRAFLALNQTGKNDYVSGLTIDQGPGNSSRFQSVNVEGVGFGGAVNLLREAADFGNLQRLCITSTIGNNGTALRINGKVSGRRNRGESTLKMDQITVGARFYNNGGPADIRGFLDGDISEVLIYDRILTDAEREQVDKYLISKYGETRKVAIPATSTGGKPLVRAAHVPPVQMFVPGFTVRELPVDLPNINNLQYRPDGKLVALGYDGNIYLLSDSDGDGLEDKVELFWENKGKLRAPIGMALTPPGYKHGNGVFVAAKGKCSLIVDTEGAGKADKEIIVAEGWQEIPHGVDALGVAFDLVMAASISDLGTASYTNGYLLDNSGKAQYRPRQRTRDDPPRRT